MDVRRLFLPVLVLLALTAACTPAATPSQAAAPTGPAAASAAQRTALEAWHLMEIGRLRTGAYSTNVLVDLPLPQGVRWTVVAFDDADYQLRVSDESGDAWLVAPGGVQPAG